MSGDLDIAGKWDLENAIEMKPVEGLRYECNLDLSKFKEDILRYKFVIKKSETGEYLWEEGENRVLEISTLRVHGAVIKEHSFAGFKCEHPKFKGTAVPVFSLRSKNSLGIGDFGDLKLLVDWDFCIANPPLESTNDDIGRSSVPAPEADVVTVHPKSLVVPCCGS